MMQTQLAALRVRPSLALLLAACVNVLRFRRHNLPRHVHSYFDLQQVGGQPPEAEGFGPAELSPKLTRHVRFDGGLLNEWSRPSANGASDSGDGHGAYNETVRARREEIQVARKTGWGGGFR